MPRHRCAILDDYQNVALNSADWSKVSAELDIEVFTEHLGGADNVVRALQGFSIVCAMRERTAFPRAVLDKLPELKLLITTGLRNASIDMAAAKERGVRLLADFRDTGHNRMMRMAYMVAGFAEHGQRADGASVLENDLTDVPPLPDFLKIQVNVDWSGS